MHSATTRSPSSGLPVWPCTHDALGPRSAAAASSTSALRAVMSTLAPASTNALAMPLPIPFDPPVTMAVLPSSRSSIDGPYRSLRAADRTTCRREDVGCGHGRLVHGPLPAAGGGVAVVGRHGGLD